MSYHFYIFPFSIDVDWDAAFELVGDGIQKIRNEIGVDSSDGFRAFLNLRLQNPKLQVSLDHLFLLTVGACKIGIFEEKMKEVLEPLSGEFSLYLHNFRNMKRNRQDLIAILEQIAIHAGRSFWWILFRINRHSEVLRIYKTQEVLVNSQPGKKTGRDGLDQPSTSYDLARSRRGGLFTGMFFIKYYIYCSLYFYVFKFFFIILICS